MRSDYPPTYRAFFPSHPDFRDTWRSETRDLRDAWISVVRDYLDPDHVVTLFAFEPGSTDWFKRTIDRWADRIDTHNDTSVEFVFAIERTTAGHLHAHGFTSGTAGIPVRDLNWTWDWMASQSRTRTESESERERRNKTRRKAGKESSGSRPRYSRIRVYDPSRRGPEYAFKKLHAHEDSGVVPGAYRRDVRPTDLAPHFRFGPNADLRAYARRTELDLQTPVSRQYRADVGTYYLNPATRLWVAAEVTRHENLPEGSLHVLDVLAHVVSEAHPGFGDGDEALGLLVGIDSSTLRRVRKALERRGLLFRLPRKDGDDLLWPLDPLQPRFVEIERDIEHRAAEQFADRPRAQRGWQSRALRELAKAERRLTALTSEVETALLDLRWGTSTAKTTPVAQASEDESEVQQKTDRSRKRRAARQRTAVRRGGQSE